MQTGFQSPLDEKRGSRQLQSKPWDRIVKDARKVPPDVARQLLGEFIEQQYGAVLGSKAADWAHAICNAFGLLLPGSPEFNIVEDANRLIKYHYMDKESKYYNRQILNRLQQECEKIIDILEDSRARWLALKMDNWSVSLETKIGRIPIKSKPDAHYRPIAIAEIVISMVRDFARSELSEIRTPRGSPRRRFRYELVALEAMRLWHAVGNKVQVGRGKRGTFVTFLAEILVILGSPKSSSTQRALYAARHAFISWKRESIESE